MADEYPVHIEFINSRVGNTALSMSTKTLPQHQALHEILAGNARLAKEHPHPPLDLIREATDLIGRVETLGPPLSSGETTDKNIDLLLRNNARQDHVHDLEVKWREGASSLRALAENCWVEYDNQGPSLLKQLRSCYETSLPRQQVVMLYNVPNETVRREQGLVRMQFGLVDIEGPVGFHQLTPSWRDFLFAIEASEAKALEAIDLGLSARRILAFEDRGPSVVRLGSSRSIASHQEGKCWYVLTRDLPEDWFFETSSKTKTITVARDWIKDLDAEIYALGKVMTREDAVALIVEQFRLSDAAALKVWKGADLSMIRRSGRVKDSQRISRMEIKEIISARSVG